MHIHLKRENHAESDGAQAARAQGQDSTGFFLSEMYIQDSGKYSVMAKMTRNSVEHQ